MISVNEITITTREQRELLLIVCLFVWSFFVCFIFFFNNLRGVLSRERNRRKQGFTLEEKRGKGRGPQSSCVLSAELKKRKVKTKNVHVSLKPWSLCQHCPSLFDLIFLFPFSNLFNIFNYFFFLLSFSLLSYGMSMAFWRRDDLLLSVAVRCSKVQSPVSKFPILSLLLRRIWWRVVILLCTIATFSTR